MEHLNEFQKEVYDECCRKSSGGISLPMGSGKTLLSLVIARHQAGTTGTILIVVSKTLLGSWEDEIKKFIPDLPYVVVKGVNTDFNWVSTTHPVVITTTETLVKAYSFWNIRENVVYYEIRPTARNLQTSIRCYRRVTRPELKTSTGGHGAFFYSTSWDCLVVDEVQNYTNINTSKCEALLSLHVNHRWGLSGTIISEPTVERLLGLYLIFDIPNTPRNLPDMHRWVRSARYPGLSSCMVIRTSNSSFVPPKLDEHVIHHSLTQEEIAIYISMKEIMNKIRDIVKKARSESDFNRMRVFSSYLLAMITYLRQYLVCPLLPLSSAAVDVYDFTEIKSKLSKMIVDELMHRLPHGYLDTVSSVQSSRMREVFRVLEHHSKERVIVFMCYRTALDIFKTFIPTTRPYFVIEEKMSSAARMGIKDAWEKSENGLFLLTYQLGAEGLNLQHASTIVLVDLWWNAAKTRQAITRAYRFGQTAATVHAYMFTSDTGIEKALLTKHSDKLNVIDDISNGPMRRNVSKMKVNELIKLINEGDNENQLKSILARK